MKIIKLLTVLTSISLMFLLVACKQNITSVDNENSSTVSSEQISDENVQSTASGIELEEDVFDTNESQQNTSSKNESTTTTPSQKEEVKEGDSEESESEKENVPTPDEENSDDTNSESSSSQEQPVVEDGVIKLPIDRFN